MDTISNVSYLFSDITYTGNGTFPYLSNLIALHEKIPCYGAVARVLCDRQYAMSFAIAFFEVLQSVIKKYTAFKQENSKLELILIDFDNAEAKGMKEAFEKLGCPELIDLLCGCQVHFDRSLQRVAKIVMKSKDEKETFLRIGRKIPKLSDKQMTSFSVLCGREPVTNAPDYLKMLSVANSGVSADTLKKGPSTTNANESINRQSFPEKGSSIVALLEHIYTEFVLLQLN